VPRQELVQQPRRKQEWERENARLREENERLKRENERLQGELEKATRAARRQAAPFSRGEPAREPFKPGRKSGSKYGRRGVRSAPAKVDQVDTAPLPARCTCGGCIKWERNEAQYQEDIECRTVTRRFDVAIGHCGVCRKRVQGRHTEQTSDALGAAAVQIGPRALGLAAVMTKQMGLSLGNAEQMLLQGFGLRVNRSTLSRALLRMADKAEWTYESLLEMARDSRVNAMDETGWRVGGRSHWAHVAVGEQATVYTIRRGRGYAEAAELVGEQYGGFLVRDGWAPYRKFGQAFHQTCLAHLLRRCRDREQADPGAAAFPGAVKSLLQRALKLRDRHGAGDIGDAGMAIAIGQLEAQWDRLLAEEPEEHENRKLARHLNQERENLFTFLRCPGLAATNHEAERALRGLVIARKVWGGNRTERGARAQAVLMSVLRTCRQQGQAALPHLIGLQHMRDAGVLDLVATDSS
jgi:transposase